MKKFLNRIMACRPRMLVYQNEEVLQQRQENGGRMAIRTGRDLAELREELGIRQREICPITGLSAGGISNLENRRDRVDEETTAGYIAALEQVHVQRTRILERVLGRKPGDKSSTREAA